jgi:hypothetical protein
MPTPNLIVRMPPDLRKLADARAERDHCNVSDVARSALRAYLTWDDGGEALHAALLRAEEAEARVKRLEKALAAARSKDSTPTVAAARQARVGARKARDEQLAAALEAATREDPATASGSPP